MSVVVQISDFRGKETVAVLRELLVRGSRGEIAAFGFNVEFKDGTQKTGFTGKYKANPAEALRVANRMSQRLNAVHDTRQAADAEDREEPDDGPPPRPTRLHK